MSFIMLSCKKDHMYSKCKANHPFRPDWEEMEEQTKGLSEQVVSLAIGSCILYVLCRRDSVLPQYSNTINIGLTTYSFVVICAM